MVQFVTATVPVRTVRSPVSAHRRHDDTVLQNESIYAIGADTVAVAVRSGLDDLYVRRQLHLGVEREANTGKWDDQRCNRWP